MLDKKNNAFIVKSIDNSKNNVAKDTKVDAGPAIVANKESDQLSVGSIIMDAYNINLNENNKINIVISPLIREENAISTPIFAFARYADEIVSVASEREKTPSIVLSIGGKMFVIKGF